MAHTSFSIYFKLAVFRYVGVAVFVPMDECNGRIPLSGHNQAGIYTLCSIGGVTHTYIHILPNVLTFIFKKCLTYTISCPWYSVLFPFQGRLVVQYLSQYTECH